MKYEAKTAQAMTDRCIEKWKAEITEFLGNDTTTADNAIEAAIEKGANGCRFYLNMADFKCEPWIIANAMRTYFRSHEFHVDVYGNMNGNPKLFSIVLGW